MPGFGIMVAFWLSGNILTFGVRLLLASRQRTKIIFPKILSLKEFFVFPQLSIFNYARLALRNFSIRAIALVRSSILAA